MEDKYLSMQKDAVIWTSYKHDWFAIIKDYIGLLVTD